MSFQEETLMFSSLNVIEDAEYTFHTTFQDHQYKVTAHSQSLNDQDQILCSIKIQTVAA